MATKFTHTRPIEEARARRALPLPRFLPFTPALRPRFGLASTLVLAACILAVLVVAGRGGMAFFGCPTVEGPAEIIGKSGATASEGTLLLQIRTADNARLTAEATLPREHWNALRVGDRVQVRYQVARDGLSLRLHDVGRIALPPVPGAAP